MGLDIRKFACFPLMFLLLASLSWHEASIASSSAVHDVAVTYVEVSDTIIPPFLGGTYIDVFVKNLGTVSETFWVAAYAKNSKNFTMGPYTISLAPDGIDYLPFFWELPIARIAIFPPPWPWPPDGPLAENFTVWAEAEVVPGDVNASNNVYIYGNVTVIWWVLDVNYDARIDISDVASVAISFGSYPGHLNWNPYVDFNSDEKIDILDIASSARFFGQTY